MAETNWTEEAPSAPKKSRVPTWAWFCGGGCLLALIVGGVLTFLGVNFIKSATDTEAQWANLAKVLPYDERPAGVDMRVGFSLGIEQYQMHDVPHGLQITIQKMGGTQGAEQRRKMFDPEHPQFPQDAGVVKFQDLKVSKIEVQGRELPLMRMRVELAGFMKSILPKEATQEGMGATALIDLTREDEPGLLFLQMIRLKGEEPISDEEIRTFLEPFHVGPKR